MSSKRYLVFSNESGTDAKAVEWQWPNEPKEKGPGGLQPVGIVYDHEHDVYGDKAMPNVVGKTISGNPEISDLVGKILLIVDAMSMDKEQREAFKSLLKQTIYTYSNEKEEEVRQIYAYCKRVEADK